MDPDVKAVLYTLALILLALYLILRVVSSIVAYHERDEVVPIGRSEAVLRGMLLLFPLGLSGLLAVWATLA